MKQIVVYVPAPETRLHIARGSGIVGEPSPDSRSVLIYYEGATHKPVNASTLADRVAHAYHQMTQRAPTVAKSRVPTSSVIPVGTYDPATKQVWPTGPESEREFARWLGTERLDPRQLFPSDK